MPALLTSDDKSKIKRHIPQASNKIITAGIARLYVALPNESRWKDTGLSGAAVLAYDEVGKCFFFKLVDVVGSQGILWDQELYEGIQYRQDRTFFHSFEISNCIAAFSFADEHEAKNFFSKVESRQKKVSSGKSSMGSMGRRMKGLFGKADKNDTSSSQNGSMAQSAYMGQTQEPAVRTSTIDPDDPEWAGLLEQLAKMGITRDQIAGNEEFIKSFVSSKQAEDPEPPPRNSVPTQHSHLAPSVPRSQAPPPPPPPAATSNGLPAPTSAAAETPVRKAPVRNLPPPVSANTAPMRSLPPPAPSVPSRDSSSSPDETTEISRRSIPPPPPASRSKNKPPPPPSRGTRQVSTPEPPSYAPSIPGKVPMDADERPTRVFNVPPPFEGVRKSASLSRPTPAAPSVPSRGPPVPSRAGPPVVPSRGAGPAVPARGDGGRAVPPPPAGGIPPPPPPPAGNASRLPPPPPSGGMPPPPPPMMPPAAQNGGSSAIAVPTAPGRDDLLASIRAGNKKGLRKTTTVDKSAPAIPGAVSAHNTGSPATPVGGGNDMASQLAAMLGERNKKVAHNSDDESDEDW